MRHLYISFLFLALFSGITSCSRDEDTDTTESVELVDINPEFSKFITAYTGGVVSTDGTIKVVLSTPVKKMDIDDVPPSSLFTLTPGVQGEVRFANAYTIEFVPSQPLEPGTLYMGTLQLGELIEIKDDLKEFKFNFHTQRPAITVVVDEIISEDEDFNVQTVLGHVELQEIRDTTGLEEVISANLDGKSMPLKWIFGAGITPRFQISGIERTSSSQRLSINWNGDSFGVESHGTKIIPIYPQELFKLREARVVNGQDQMVELHFNEPLNSRQDVKGLITMRKVDDKSLVSIQAQVSGSKVVIMPSKHLAGDYDLEVSKSLQNANGEQLSADEYAEVNLSDLEPEVELIGDGVIVPTGSSLHVPFKTVNMNAVEVVVRRIYQNNVLQFLQINELDEYSQLNRVGSVIYKGDQMLDEKGELDLHSWNNFSLDLSKVIKREKGAIYHVTLSLKPEHSVYRCSGSGTAVNEGYTGLTYLNHDGEEDWNENDWGSYYDSEWYSWHHSYNYRERNDPCKSSYYRNKKTSKNILISDLGLIMKAGTDKTIHGFVTDLNTTDALSGAQVTFYDYQQQELATVSTDAAGMCLSTIAKKPYAAVVSHNGQKGYLKLANSLSNSISKFDVGGTTNRKGVKGFIYCERGVRRPGDTIHLNFMLEDRDHFLPSSHPVEVTISDPKGKVVHKEVRTTQTAGITSFHFPTRQDAPTGNYMAKVTVGNHVFNKLLRVETVKPNRLKIKTGFQDKILMAGRDKVTLESRWLHGAVAKDLKAKVDVRLNASELDLKKYKDYVFQDPTKNYSVEQQTVFEGKLDQTGKVEFPMNLHIGNSAPGMMKAFLDIKVFEKGGGFSVDKAEVKYSPYMGYVGIKLPEKARKSGQLNTGESNTVSIASLDAYGNPRASRVSIKVLRVGSYSWYDSYGESLGYYLRKTGVRCVKDETINVPASGGSFTFNVPKSDWGNYLVYVKDLNTGHASGTTVMVDWPYGHRVKDEGGATMLDLSLSKDNYTVGEDIEVSFPSPENGKALITLENGKGLMLKKWVNTQAGNTKIDLKSTADMAPNVYVHVSVIQPHGRVTNDMPIRTYGVMPVTINNPDSELDPVISMRESLKPESVASIRIGEKGGKAMTYTLAIVDDGLLDLTHFKTPSPKDHFYAKEALGVRTWDVYDDVRSALGTKIDKMLAVGGGADGINPEAVKANRFKPMVRVLGPFHVEAGETKTHKVSIPNYVGSCRVMVVAREGRAYGKAEKTVKVKAPLMVLSTLPRVVSPGEEVVLPVDVFAMENDVKTVAVSVVTNDLFTALESTNKVVKFKNTGDQVVNFKYRVSDKVGIAKVKVQVKSGEHRAHHEIELDVRPPNPFQNKVQFAVVNPGETWESSLAEFGMEGTQSATLEVSSFAHIDLDRRLKYLVQYPHGCVEQTTSSGFPQLYLAKLMDLDQDYKNSIQNNVKATITRLQSFQTSSGGLGYWPGASYVNDWGTNYAGHFMLEAEKLGYHVPRGFKSKWISYQRDAARKWERPTNGRVAHYRDLEQSYRLYTLALAGKPEIGAMNRLRSRNDLSLPARWRLAAAYALVGKSQVAESLISRASTTVEDYTELSYTFGTSTRDEAMILEALTQMDMEEKASTVALRLARDLSDDRWMSTQTTAYCLLAIGKFIGTQNIDDKMTFERSFGSEKTLVSSTKTMHRSEVEGSAPKATVKNTSSGKIYVRLVYTGIPKAGAEEAYANDLTMNVTYETLEGTPITVTKLPQGTDFVAKVTIRNPGTRGDLKEMALDQLVPSGWEIHNSRMSEGQQAITSSPFTYQDIRDDRLHTYFDLRSGESKTFKVVLNATYQGKFYLPAISAYAMYDESISASSAGQWIEVVSSGDGTL